MAANGPSAVPVKRPHILRRGLELGCVDQALRRVPPPTIVGDPYNRFYYTESTAGCKTYGGRRRGRRGVRVEEGDGRAKAGRGCVGAPWVGSAPFRRSRLSRARRPRPRLYPRSHYLPPPPCLRCRSARALCRRPSQTTSRWSRRSTGPLVHN